MKPDLGLPLDEAVVGQAVGKLPAHVVAYVAEVERLEVTVAHGVEEYEDGHHLAVRHAARTVAAAFATGVQRVFVSNVCFFSSGVKYLQNSSRIQKISIKFASVMGMDVFM